MAFTTDEIKWILNQYDISMCECDCMDTSHSVSDVRLNYIIDKKYVLRMHSAKVMNEQRISELNRLVDRYHQFGLKTTYFIKNKDDTYLMEYKNYQCYVSEYLDYPLAEEVKEKYKDQLIKERLIMVSKFANKYKNVDLIDTKSMYTLFDLSPYDEVNGIDEKQDNCNTLLQDLRDMEEYDLANSIETFNASLREELLHMYKSLPKAVFQGDENFSNLCVNEEGHIIGLFDYNMSGSEVIVNYLANLALLDHPYYEENDVDEMSVKEIMDYVISFYKENTRIIKENYKFTEEEEKAYRLYSKIVMFSGYANQSAFSEMMKKENRKDKVMEILNFIINVHL